MRAHDENVSICNAWGPYFGVRPKSVQTESGWPGNVPGLDRCS